MNWKSKLREARLAKGYIKKVRFAEAIGVSAATVTDWEKPVDDGGIKNINGHHLVKVCRLLDIDEGYLLGEEHKSAPSLGENRARDETSPATLPVIEDAEWKAMSVKKQTFIERVALSEISDLEIAILEGVMDSLAATLPQAEAGTPEPTPESKPASAMAKYVGTVNLSMGLRSKRRTKKARSKETGK